MEKPTTLHDIPQGYSSYITNAGIKDNSLDLGIIVSAVPATAAAMFTTNKICGNPIKVGKKHIKKGKIKALVVNSKNSNVATGEEGYRAAVDTCKAIARELQIDKSEVFPSSTGVIGRRLPVEKIIAAVQDLPDKLTSPADFIGFAKAIMTTDTYPKFTSRRVGNAVIVGVAKGSGMIEPNMATMLSYFFTDAKIAPRKLKKILHCIVEETFNSLSVDSDTSTSDTVLALANGLAGKVNEKEFIKAFREIAVELTRHLARDGEGATKLFIVDVTRAHSDKQAKKIAKSIINSPLVKTAIYKGDPNWGRIFMAIGKTPNVSIKPERIKLYWGPEKLEITNDKLKALSDYLIANEELLLTVDLGLGKGKARVYGCDYTEEYIKINAYYTT